MSVAELIEAWEREADLAEGLRRVDGYAALCRETVRALRAAHPATPQPEDH